MDILQYTGMSPEQLDQYAQAEAKLGPRVKPLVQAYFDGVYDHIDGVHEPLKALCATAEEQWAAELVFVVLCARMREKTLSGREHEQFLDGLSDIGCKVNECLAYKKCLGIFVLSWYHGFLKEKRLTLGRLQFEVRQQGEQERVIGDLVMRPGDRKLVCHIPSSGPLTQQACFDSYHRAWEEFPELRRNGVLPIFCHSWLFYPGYDQVFTPESNTGKFRSNFTMYETYETERFDDCWRVFSMDVPENLSLLPRDTAMRRRFAAYIEQGGTFGTTAGVLLFDGEKLVPVKMQNA